MTIFSIFLITNFYIDHIRCQLDSLESEDALIEWLSTTYEDIASGLCNKQMLASWAYNTNINDANAQAALAEVTVEVAQTRRQYWEDYFNRIEVDEYVSERLKRQLRSLKNLGTAALDSEQLTQLTNTQSTMSNIYSTAKICPYANQECDDEDELSLEPDIEAVMSSSTDYDELEYTWVAWRAASGAKIRSYYGEYVDLSNRAAEANGYNDMGAMWKDRYETDNFENSLDLLWEQVKPLYDELHTYVRRKLQVLYGEKAEMSDGLIPAHILGNMWAQSWVNIAKHVKPFPDASEVDVTGAMVAQGYTPRRMFEESNQFYMEMGLEDNYMSYGSDAMIEKPADREVLCHASAWDFCDGEDFRIKMCTNVDMEDFITVHHEMGHIQYYLQYKDQPYSFRGGANPGFHEAVGDTIALSVATPKHLQKIGLLPDYVDNEESSINALMDMALERVAFLPFGYLIDKWRWDVFSGDVEESEWNSHWWYYRNTLQKVKAPVDRTEDDFDPGAKYHIPGNSQYINYFVAHILEFQLYRGLCREAGEYDPEDPDLPLHKCDFDQNTAAGAKLSAGLSLGSSVHWSEALEAMTGETELDATALLEYFQPLYEYLREQNLIASESELQQFLDGEYAEAAEAIYNAQVTAEWNYAVDVANQEAQNAQNQATLETAAFEKSYWTDIFQHLDPENYVDETLQRQITFLKVLGNAALPEDKLSELTDSITAMTTTYSTAKICPYGNEECDLAEEGLSLDPDIESIISTSTDYDELLYVWRAWRDASGSRMKDSFRTYVELSNEAADANGFEDKGEMWRNDFESDTFIDDVDKLWTVVEPLYKELHTFVLKKLKTRYSNQIDKEETLIPAHVLGNMWAQTWNNIADLVKPYPDASEVDITAALIAKGYTVLQMFDVANEFYMSLGLEDSAMSYDVERGAMIEKPEGREVLCHASAWDFYDGENFRIKMCTTVNYNDFVTIHHELGHIQYFLLYKDKPITLRTGANPGFHEAVGDTIALSVATPQHFVTIGLLDEYEDNEEASINALMDMALERVAFLPFGLLIDKWRWDVFSGDVEEDEWNDRWWNYRETLQKVKAPVERAADDFDPGAKFHVAADSQYISYFIAHILEFQLFKALCIEAGQYDPETKDSPLHKCDFYQSEAAGQLLRAGLSLGSSVHWSKVLEAMTGETELDATALLEYFQPLYEYLKETNDRETALQDFFDGEYAEAAGRIYNAQVTAEWNFAVDVDNEEAQETQTQVTLETAEFEKSQWTDKFQHLQPNDYIDVSLQRQVKFLKVLGNAALEEEKLEELTNSISTMTSVYSTAKICPYGNDGCDLAEEGFRLDPDIESRMSISTDYDELLYLWRSWRDVSGAQIRDNFKTYVELSNEAAAVNGFGDKGAMWRNDFESDTFIEDVDKLWAAVEPLYTELHQFVLNKLKIRYKDQIDEDETLIPAHVLGNMWAQSWNNIAALVKPYPDESPVDMKAALENSGYDELQMFDVANEFYTSLGLEDGARSYDEEQGALIKKPDREVLCHASAWDFYDGEDFRIKMCTEVDYNDFVTIHHELGHIQYYLLYKDQPITLRRGANPGFHEAVGDTIALSVATPQHFKTIGLLEEYDDTEEASINALMDTALERVAFLPFGLLIDKWRWDVFSGDVSEDEWNERWWHYRGTLQKVKAPVPRTEDDFDPGAKFHVAADYQYISYFIAHILEFQLFKALCIEAGQYNPDTMDIPLHKCDFYNSSEAGQLLRNGLSLGSSVHWTVALKEMTGETELDATALLEYFQPLYVYLRAQNIMASESQLQQFLDGEYAEAAKAIYNAQVTAEWNYAVDVANEQAQDDQHQATLETAAFEKSYWTEVFQHLDPENYVDETLQRQIKFLRVLGNAALPEDKLSELTESITAMTTAYSTAKICPYGNEECDPAEEGLSLDPDIESIISTSTDYDELLYVWRAWRDASGATMKDSFRTYVELSNEAAKANGFEDKGEMWRNDFESDTFIDDVDKLWRDVEPLYKELHTFVLNKLKTRYSDQIDEEETLIPAHVLGNMWAQTWNNIADLVKPYPDASEVDITAALIAKGYNVLQMFDVANEFYTSLGLENSAMSYDVERGAMIEKPDEREVLCHASAWDFYDGEDFRIKMCTTVNYNDFVTIHHELGHIQYFLLYKDQPITLRTGANPGFHEAVGDTIALSVATPQHFETIGLLDEYEDNEEASINALMDMALERVAFLPFGLLIDKWRWDVFSGDVEEDEWNDRWWQYRETLQKVKAPVERTADDFDPGAKFHVAADYQYISYFIAHIVEFQFFKALCIEAGQYDPETKDPPLHKCDFYKSEAAGQLLRNGLELGASQHWSEVLERITGETDISASALLEYFDPLYEYLKEANSALVLHISHLTYISAFLVAYFVPRLMR